MAIYKPILNGWCIIINVDIRMNIINQVLTDFVPLVQPRNWLRLLSVQIEIPDLNVYNSSTEFPLWLFLELTVHPSFLQTSVFKLYVIIHHAFHHRSFVCHSSLGCTTTARLRQICELRIIRTIVILHYLWSSKLVLQLRKLWRCCSKGSKSKWQRPVDMRLFAWRNAVI